MPLAGHVSVLSVQEEEMKGVNTRQELAEVEALMQYRLRAGLMEGGITLQNPSGVYLCHDTQIGADTIIEPHQVSVLASLLAAMLNSRLLAGMKGQRLRKGPLLALTRVAPWNNAGQGREDRQFC